MINAADHALLLEPAIHKVALTKVNAQRAASLICVVFSGACLIYAYVNWLAPTYSYLGFTLDDGNQEVLWFSASVVMVSACLLPLRLHKFSDYFLWMIFYFVYLPSMLFVPLQGTLADGGFALVCALGLSFNVMRLLGRYKLKLPRLRIDKIILNIAFFSIYGVLLTYTITVFGANLRFASLAEIYTQRFLASDIIAGTFVGYATGLLSGAFDPFLMAYGLTRRKPLWFVIGAGGQLIVYATSALKSVALSILLLPAFYFLLIRRGSVTSDRLGLILAGSCICPLLLLPSLEAGSNGLVVQLVALILMRTYGLAGALTGVYANFFSSHPHTAFSHINLVSHFIDYPYQDSLGEEVGFALVGSKLDANANFWASDGIAAAGDFGVILLGLIVGALLIVANSSVEQDDRRLAFTAFIPFIMTACNTSIFTSLLTSGGAALLLIFYLRRSSPRQHNLAA